MKGQKTYRTSLGAYELRVAIPHPTWIPQTRRPRLHGITLRLFEKGQWDQPLIEIKNASAFPHRPPWSQSRLWIFKRANDLFHLVNEVFADVHFDAKTDRLIQAQFPTDVTRWAVWHIVLLNALDEILLKAYPIPKRAKL